MVETGYLNDHFLIAMPNMTGSLFSRAVIYVNEHSAEGATGFIINHPMDVHVGDVMHQLDIPCEDETINTQPVLSGGPVKTHQGFIIHRLEDPAKENRIVITTSLELLNKMAKGGGPTEYLMILGYSGWDPKQLESEIASNCWLSCRADDRIVFETPFAQRWEGAVALVGVDPTKLSGDIGHA